VASRAKKKTVDDGTRGRAIGHIRVSSVGGEFATIETALAWSLAPAVPVGSVVPADRMMIVRGFARRLARQERSRTAAGIGARDRGL
jgi:hypothetical protein